MATDLKKFYMNFDGGCMGGNPGGVAIASWIIRGPDTEIIEVGAEEVCRGNGATNNVAEWAGLVYGLRSLAKFTEGIISIRGDSLLVVNQVNGVFQVRHEHLKPWHKQALEALSHFDQWKITHVKRHLNEEADMAGKDKYKEIVGQ